MVEYRGAKPEERDAYIELANCAFGFDVEALLPKVYAQGIDSSAIHKVAVDEKGKLRAEAVVLPETLIVCDKELKAGFLGIVSVHPKSRGEGHMKALINMWLEEAKTTCDMLVLWGQRQRYEYFGFTRGGIRLKYTVNIANLHHALKNVSAEGLSFCPLFEVDGAATFAKKLNDARISHVVRDEWNMPLILATLLQRAIGVLKAGELIGYLIVDKKGEEITELALEHSSDIACVVKAYMKHSGVGSIKISVPGYEKEMNVILDEFAEEYTIDGECMYNIFNFANILEAYLNLKYQTTGLVPGKFSALMDGQPVTACVDEYGVSVKRMAEESAINLDKMQAQALLLTEYGRYRDIPVPAGWFPLPLFWYNADKF